MKSIDGDDALYRDRRRHSREFCECPGLLLHDLGEEDCTVVDLSPGGAKIRIDQVLEAYMPVRLKMTRDGEFAGEVVWIAAGAVGLRFTHHPVD